MLAVGALTLVVNGGAPKFDAKASAVLLQKMTL